MRLRMMMCKRLQSITVSLLLLGLLFPLSGLGQNHKNRESYHGFGCRKGLPCPPDLRNPPGPQPLPQARLLAPLELATSDKPWRLHRPSRIQRPAPLPS